MRSDMKLGGFVIAWLHIFRNSEILVDHSYEISGVVGVLGI